MIAQIKKEEVENYWGIKRDDKWVVNKLLPTNRDKMGSEQIITNQSR